MTETLYCFHRKGEMKEHKRNHERRGWTRKKNPKKLKIRVNGRLAEDMSSYVTHMVPSLSVSLGDLREVGHRSQNQKQLVRSQGQEK